MKLLDFMKTEGRERMGSATEISFEIADLLAEGEIPAFDVTNVYDYVKANIYTGEHTISIQQLFHAIPFCVPPFKEQWVEFDMAQNEMTFGLHVGRFESASAFGQDQIKNLADRFESNLLDIGQKSKWLVFSHIFAKDWNKSFVNHAALVVRFLDEAGAIMKVGVGPGSWSTSIILFIDDKLADSEEANFGPSYATLMTCLAFGFLSCKNVTTSEVTRPRVERRQAKREGRDLSRFHILEIGPIARAISQEGNLKENGPVKALHIVRGHFATYTKERPLFGKVVGRVFREAHTRGSAEVGKVTKNYKINPNKK